MIVCCLPASVTHTTLGANLRQGGVHGLEVRRVVGGHAGQVPVAGVPIQMQQPHLAPSSAHLHTHKHATVGDGFRVAIGRAVGGI